MFRKSSFLSALIICLGEVLTANSAYSWVDILYYRFEEGVSGGVATGVGSIMDSSGNGLNAQGMNSPIYSSDIPLSTIPQTNSNNRLSMHFNGTNQQITVADNPKFELTQSLTLEAFIKPESDPVYNGEGHIVFRGDDRAYYDPYFLEMIPNKTLKFQIQKDPSSIVYLTCTIPSFNQWYHVAGTLDDSTGQMKLYVNGVLQNSTTTTIRPLGALNTSSRPGIGIGNVEQGTYGEYFHGYIDEVRISDQVLRPDQFLNATPVPEPGSLVFSGLTITAILLISLKRKKRRLPRT